MTPEACEEELRYLQACHQLRVLSPVDSAAGSVVRQGGRTLINFCSNNYLGLAHHPVLKEAARLALRRFGVGAGASRHLCGNHRLYEQLEDEIAAFKSTEAALVFSSGYAANIGALGAWVQEGDLIFCDRLSHASLIQGARESAGTLRVYRHNDVEHLHAQLKRRRGRGGVWIVTDGVFSMDGEIAPVPDLLALAEAYDATVYIDDAHATGVLGANGAGTCDYFNLNHPRILQMGTFSKALGGLGGFVCASTAQIRYLVNKAKPFIYTTALPPILLASARAALQWVKTHPAQREKLRRQADFVRTALGAMGFQVGQGITPIIPLQIGKSEKALDFSQRLLSEGFLIPAIRPPTVPEGSARLRIGLMATHTKTQIARLLEALQRVGQSTRVI
jgi:8-amino-7-oxononanoate synthase